GSGEKYHFHCRESRSLKKHCDDDERQINEARNEGEEPDKLGAAIQALKKKIPHRMKASGCQNKNDGKQVHSDTSTLTCETRENAPSLPRPCRRGRYD